MATDISNGDFAYAEEYLISSGGLDMVSLRTSAANGIISFGGRRGEEVALVRWVSWILKPK
jgi:hypothetical protein